MNSESCLERDLLLRQLGASEERIRQLERTVFEQQWRSASDSREWQRLQFHRRELGEWLVDQATSTSGQFVKSSIDAGLGGETFVPCSFSVSVNGRRYQLDLTSTRY